MTIEQVTEVVKLVDEVNKTGWKVSFVFKRINFFNVIVTRNKSNKQLNNNIEFKDYASIIKVLNKMKGENDE